MRALRPAAWLTLLLALSPLAIDAQATAIALLLAVPLAAFIAATVTRRTS